MRLNQWSFRGQLLNSPNVRIRKMTGPFSLPSLRGEDFLTMGRTGRLFVPKIHDSRRISLEIIVRDMPAGVTAGIFDQFALWAANRTQGALANILDSGARTAQAECVGWMPQDITVGGLTHVGVADFLLADPWLYGATVSGSVTPTGGGAALSLTHPGTVTAEKVTLDILGPIVTPVISNATTGTSLTVALTVASTKHLVVNTDLFTALNDGANVVGSVTHSGAVAFLTLAPGVNTLTASGGSTTGSSLVTVSFAVPYE